ncbi:MAG: hypothetical protein GOMPHAMPRED_002290 [Gomphillus americanus]|uniref:Protein farnesyltransferase subunit beta n=1 Tax=Gomphillus americanus TaxID=1940652 RepID=A0A8H3FD04_9LECA|nr:MAG: hypothetical protein GOMPHAMPRED_002290 [Gomphillus americanus]
MALPQFLPNVSLVFCETPLIQDDLQTVTSQSQQTTLEDVLPYILGSAGGPHKLNSNGFPKLKRDAHVKFLRKTLEKMSGAYTAMDAARPWILYWTLTALSLLGQDVSNRVLSTLAAFQNDTGGFAGGHGQISHIATTFAAVLSLAIVGGSQAFDMIHRRALWTWLGQVKAKEGGFYMAAGAELDARGVYCAMVIIVLLNLPLDLPSDAPARQAGLTSFVDRVPEWISRCQSYEGGLSARPNGEAHAAYTYCGLACLSILGEPDKMLNEYLNMSSLLDWISARQNAPEGGFSGRTNKLVDSCYSHWVGSCWYFIKEALKVEDENELEDSIWNKEGILRYVLCAGQNETGGMRDKPYMRPDGYHSCYALAGLSAMQHQQTFKPSSNLTDPLYYAFGWNVDESEKTTRNDAEEDFLVPLHPIFTIPYDAVHAFRIMAMGKESF